MSEPWQNTPRTLLDEGRRKSLCDLMRRFADVPGIVVELGAYRGGSAVMMKQADPRRKVYAFDTFEGGLFNLSKWEQEQNHSRSKDCELYDGQFADIDGAEVMKYLEDNGVTPVKGRFPESAVGIEGPIALAHFDGDTYESCRDFIAWAWPRMAKGGVLVMDDFGWPATPGVYRAYCERFSMAYLRNTATWQGAIIAGVDV